MRTRGTRLYVEGKHARDAWWTRVYWVPVFSMKAAERWIPVADGMTVPGERTREGLGRLLRIRTICQMERVQ